MKRAFVVVATALVVLVSGHQKKYDDKLDQRDLTIDADAVKAIVFKYEKPALESYQDPASGLWYIGYGHTSDNVK